MLIDFLPMISQLIYHSIAVESLTAQDIQDILQTARSFNTDHQITGCLLFHNREFLQILEGEKKAVHQLYDKITLDNRHTHVYTIFEDLSTDRLYQNWAMAYHALRTHDMQELEGILPMQDFINLHTLKEATSHSQMMFYFVANKIMKQQW